ncbi:hypothetical protein CVT25_013364 [Psilocybe cyanescens]|uniref:Uncharacterized protein n=1 Tax=Psilocybe cyanescens TaxID=93625 RepID=A0A409WSL4_PSICY|nr:hypothetical protein CVT25_013364 [Psilocybe cyanescens]
MSTPDIPIPVNVQENEISASLNASMLFNFIMVSKKPANINRHIIIWTITALYLLCFLNLIVEWYLLNWTIVISGDTREAIFVGTVGDGLQWAFILNNILQNSLFIVSDGLLIWRCYHVWGQLFWAISSPLILLVVEGAYSLVLLLYAIDLVVPSFDVLGSPMAKAGYYIGEIVTVVAKQGMAPTILVSRIALTDPNSIDTSATLTHVSGGLEFGSHQCSGSGRGGNATGDCNTSVQADDAKPTPVIEVKRESRAGAQSGSLKLIAANQ